MVTHFLTVDMKNLTFVRTHSNRDPRAKEAIVLVPFQSYLDLSTLTPIKRSLNDDPGEKALSYKTEGPLKGKRGIVSSTILRSHMTIEQSFSH